MLEPGATFRRFVTSDRRTEDLPLPPVPHQECRAVFLEKRRTDRPGEARVVELDADIFARLLAAGARLLGGAQLGAPGVDAEVRCAVTPLLVVGDGPDLDVTIRTRIVRTRQT